MLYNFDSITIGKRFYDLRIKNNLTISDVANMLGYDSSIIEKIEAGSKRIKYSIYKEVAELYRANANELLGIYDIDFSIYTNCINFICEYFYLNYYSLFIWTSHGNVRNIVEAKKTLVYILNTYYRLDIAKIKELFGYKEVILLNYLNNADDEIYTIYRDFIKRKNYRIYEFDSISVGKIFYRLRIKNNLSDSDVVKALQISYTLLDECEYGSRYVSFSDYELLANFYGVNIYDVLKINEPNPSPYKKIIDSACSYYHLNYYSLLCSLSPKDRKIRKKAKKALIYILHDYLGLPIKIIPKILSIPDSHVALDLYNEVDINNINDSKKIMDGLKYKNNTFLPEGK